MLAALCTACPASRRPTAPTAFPSRCGCWCAPTRPRGLQRRRATHVVAGVRPPPALSRHRPGERQPDHRRPLRRRASTAMDPPPDGAAALTLNPPEGDGDRRRHRRRSGRREVHGQGRHGSTGRPVRAPEPELVRRERRHQPPAHQPTSRTRSPSTRRRRSSGRPRTRRTKKTASATTRTSRRSSSSSATTATAWAGSRAPRRCGDDALKRRMRRLTGRPAAGAAPPSARGVHGARADDRAATPARRGAAAGARPDRRQQAEQGPQAEEVRRGRIPQGGAGKGGHRRRAPADRASTPRARSIRSASPSRSIRRAWASKRRRPSRRSSSSSSRPRWAANRSPSRSSTGTSSS